MKPGLAAGVNCKIIFNKQFAIHTDVLYSSKGYREKCKNGILNYDNRYTLSYLEIPILFAYTLPTESFAKEIVYMGPALSICLAAEREIAGFHPTEPSGVTDIKSQIETLDMGMAFGGVIDIPAGIHDITIDIRYTLCFIKLQNKLKHKNGYLTIMFGYGIFLNKSLPSHIDTIIIPDCLF